VGKLTDSDNRLPLFFVGVGLILVILALVIVGATLLSPQQESAVSGAVRFSAPTLELIDLKGNRVSLEDYRDQVVLVNNWATWCPPCRAEMPLLETFFRKYASEGFVLIGVNAGESTTEVAEFVETYDLSFPMWLDRDGLALRAFRSNALPSSYVIDRDGSVCFAWLGAITEKVLEDNVTPLLFEAD
jgi:thiol-disulfide isomerase/thioredoxin